MPHNHPPRCCCLRVALHAHRNDPPCPSCPQHGELAQLADNECPSCHQLPGRGHTDYCPTRRCNCDPGPDGHPHRDYCNLNQALTQTTQPATRTTTPPTQLRAGGRVERGGPYLLNREPLAGNIEVRHPHPNGGMASDTTHYPTAGQPHPLHECGTTGCDVTEPTPLAQTRTFGDTCRSCFGPATLRARPGCDIPDIGHVEPLATPTPYRDAHPSECAHNTRGNDGTCYRCGAPRT